MISRLARTGLVASALLAAAATAAPAATAPDKFDFAFTTKNAKSAAGYKIKADFPRQRIIDRMTINFPAGTKFDTRAVVRCTATSDQVDAAPNGVSDVCPAASKVGTGTGTAFLGDGTAPVVFQLGLYNRANGALLDIVLGGKTAFTSVPTISGRRMIITLSQTPSLKARITAFKLSIAKKGKASKPYLRTPSKCPSSKKLTATITARENGAGSVTTKDTTACRR